jgi:hypothetical protein
MPLCHAANLSPADITFSGPIKWKMYERFKTLMAKRLVKRIKRDNWMNNKNQDFDYQARKLLIKTKTADGKPLRNPSIHHEHEDDLDDVMDSCAGCIHLADSGMQANISAEFIDLSDTPEHDAEIEAEIVKQENNKLTFNY